MTVRMKTNEMQLRLVESIGRTPTFLKCPSCYFPFSVFFGIDVPFAWKKFIQQDCQN